MDSTEADHRRGWISIESPVGSALLGKRQGDSVEISTPGGEQRLQIVVVE